MEDDEWQRDEELGGASSVAVFRRLELEGREQKGREVLKGLQLQGEPHELLATHMHPAHPNSKEPKSSKEIGLCVKKKMEEFREAFMGVEEIWFEQEVAVICGGWIERLVAAVEECEFLVLKRDGGNMKNDRGAWVIELVGGVSNPKEFWPREGETSLDHIPLDWMLREDNSSEGGWEGSTDMEGDISWNESEDDGKIEGPAPWESSDSVWGARGVAKGWEDSLPLEGMGWVQADLEDPDDSYGEFGIIAIVKS